MKPLGILHLYRLRAGSRLIQEALALIGIAVGVALLFSSQVANTSLNGSVAQLTSGLVGRSRLELLAAGQSGLPERLLPAVQRLPGVRSAAPVLEASANIVGPHGTRSVELIGADPRFVHLGGQLLRHFSAAALERQRALALPAPVAKEIGAPSLGVVSLQLAAKTMPVLLGATLQEAEIGALVHSPVVLAPLIYAQELADMTGRVSRIFVRPQAGHEQEVRHGLQSLAGRGMSVESSDYDSVQFANAAKPTNQSTALFAAISALVGFLFAYNAMLLTVPARRALIADLRLDGYRPSTALQILTFDAFILGLLASVVGLALGDEISLRLFHENPGYLSFAFPVGSQRIVTWQSVALAVAGGMLAAFAGVLIPMRDALTWRPRDHKPRARYPAPRRLLPIAGAVCLAITTGILLFAPQSAVVGVVSLTIALLLLLPSLIRLTLLCVDRLIFDIRASSLSIAVKELKAPSMWTRTVAVAATGAIAVFGSVSIDGTRADLERGLDASAHGIDSTANVWITPRGESDSFATVPFPATGGAMLAAIPGVRRVEVYRGGFLNYGERRVWVVAPPPSVRKLVAASQLVEGDLARVRAELRSEGWIVMSKSLADVHHLRIGESFLLPTPGARRFRLAGVITNLGWPSGAIIMNATDYAQAWGSANITAYQLGLDSTVSTPAVLAAIRSALGSGSALMVETSGGRERKHFEQARQGLSRLTTIRTLVLIASILAMAAAMGNMVWQRRTRLARLKLDGYSTTAVWRALLLEGILVVGSGCFAGAIFGLYGQVLGSRAILTVTGFPVIYRFGAPVAFASFVIVTAVAVAVTAIPGYMVARVPAKVGVAN